MKVLAPDYYSSFQCLQGKCRHTCCVGWEIDIDDESLEQYKKISGPFAARLKESIVVSEDGIASFRLDQNDRCPFLNKEGLCDMILALGENALCQICSDHPRFRHCFSDRIEIGLGLCCEAAGELILKREKPVSYVLLSDDGKREACYEEEIELDHLRKQLSKIIQNREEPVSIRVKRLLLLTECSIDQLEKIDWIDFLLGLERLDDAWTERLTLLKSQSYSTDDVFQTKEWEIAWEQLLVYLMNRHLPAALYDGDWKQYINYCVFVWIWLVRLCASQAAQSGTITLDDLVEIARLYSSEIEYSDENTSAILNRIRLLCDEI